MFRRTALASAFALVSSVAFAAPVTYTIDPGHTQTIFSWNHFGYSNPSANFDSIEGTLTYDDADPTKSSVDVTIAVDSINSHVKKFDDHLKSDDFFDVAQFPTATFKSTRVEKGATDGSYKVTGDLTIHGVTKSVTIDAKLNARNEHPMKKVPAIGFDGALAIKRSDFGMGKYAPNVSDEVTIRITLEAMGPKPAEAK
ncbi:MAG TPA: YceI family protein [Dokdonella sp.]|uniref:YceI family protein n=1 Tax=Dokdonella sp. TaxID=2291710 RepID=UPI0025BAA318|nr:YceI family protein [Dokdonella sp.]MBX3690776.1 polyisoprenoid-binding protein [Dokdonella sp.]MCW5568620.1 polyisoprenoid-binding protein [Dokdonella sp.]HNR91536.1 YceI family protein [Dokdonella sp.]